MKLLYKPVSIVVRVLGGMLATAIFKKVWKAASGEEEAPNPTGYWPGEDSGADQAKEEATGKRA
jgi:hypothetical protein